MCVNNNVLTTCCSYKQANMVVYLSITKRYIVTATPILKSYTVGYACSSVCVRVQHKADV